MINPSVCSPVPSRACHSRSCTTEASAAASSAPVDAVECSGCSAVALPDPKQVGLEAAASAVGGPTGVAFRLLVAGPPGSGKSTQGRTIAAEHGVPHISTGDLLRAEVEGKTDLGKIIGPLIEKGEMAPDELMLEILDQRLAKEDAQQGFVLDGFPRTMAQVPAFDARFPEGVSLLHIDVDDDQVRHRLLARGRKDDTLEVINHRLDVYAEQTRPVIEEFASRGLVVRVDGNGDIEQTAANVRQALDPHTT